MLVSVTGLCWELSLSLAPRFVSKARASCNARPGVSCAGRTSAKVVQSLLGALVLLIVAPSASGAQLRIGGGLIEIELVGSASAAWETVARQWVERSARAVSDYFGKFPVARLRLRIASSAGDRARNGTAYGWRGPFITIALGRDATMPVSQMTGCLRMRWSIWHFLRFRNDTTGLRRDSPPMSNPSLRPVPAC